MRLSTPGAEGLLCRTRKTGFCRFFIGCFLALPLIAAAADNKDMAAREIEALITAVETSECVFDRNGDRHDDADAADHLRLKYRRGKRYADTAEHFIERLASKSSWSGRAYYIECEDERVPSAEWLLRELEALRTAAD